jgi:hypothetical protein
MYGGVEFLSSKKQGAPQAQEEPDENIQIPF